MLKLKNIRTSSDYSSGSSQSSGTVKIYGDLAVGNGVHFNALAGPSNDNRSAYACLDRYGNLYRSDSPCR